MRLSDLPDPRIRSLAKDFQRADREINDLLLTILDSPLSGRANAMLKLRDRIRLLRIGAERWADKMLPRFFDEAATGIARDISGAGLVVTDLAAVGARGVALSGLRSAFLERINTALTSVFATANQITQGPLPSEGREREKFRRNLQKPLRVLGPAGKTRTYELSYYVSMVATAAFVQARNVPARLHGMLSGLDLVRVSSNDSLTGDYCDAYKGKVFSLSGSHPVYPSLASTPNGGPPFHPWCLHYLTPVLPGDDLSESEPVPQSLLMEQHDHNAGRLQTAWERRRP